MANPTEEILAEKLLKRLLDAEDAVESAHDPECWEGSQPNPRQIEAIQEAERLWMAAKKAGRQYFEEATKRSLHRQVP